MPIESARITADVWLVLTRKTIKHEPVNSSSIASALIDSWPHIYANQNSLRQRVDAVVTRVKTLERYVPEDPRSTATPGIGCILLKKSASATTERRGG
jgi:hypothetical protein